MARECIVSHSTAAYPAGPRLLSGEHSLLRRWQLHPRPRAAPEVPPLAASRVHGDECTGHHAEHMMQEESASRRPSPLALDARLMQEDSIQAGTLPSRSCSAGAVRPHAGVTRSFHEEHTGR